MPASNLRSAMEQSPTLRNVFLQYGHAFVVQTEQTALANGRNKVEERLARWILMAHDRGEGVFRTGGNIVSKLDVFVGHEGSLTNTYPSPEKSAT